MRYKKNDLIARLGEPAEERTRPDRSHPGSMVHVLRWECGCGAARTNDEPLWTWDGSDCTRHSGGLEETLQNVQPPEPEFD